MLIEKERGREGERKDARQFKGLTLMLSPTLVCVYTRMHFAKCACTVHVHCVCVCVFICTLYMYCRYALLGHVNLYMHAMCIFWQCLRGFVDLNFQDVSAVPFRNIGYYVNCFLMLTCLCYYSPCLPPSLCLWWSCLPSCVVLNWLNSPR